MILIHFNYFEFLLDKVPFSVTSVMLLQGLSSAFIQEQMSCTPIKNEDKTDSNCFNIWFSSPLLISADSTYKLTLNLKLNQMEEIEEEIVPGPFSIQYQRNFQKTLILLDFESLTRTNLSIYEFHIY